REQAHTLEGVAASACDRGCYLEALPRVLREVDLDEHGQRFAHVGGRILVPPVLRGQETPQVQAQSDAVAIAVRGVVHPSLLVEPLALAKVTRQVGSSAEVEGRERDVGRP